MIRGRYRGLRGDIPGGREDIEAGRALIREFGAAFYVAGSAQEYTAFELDAGDYAAAEVGAREAFGMFEAMGSGTLSAGAASLLAQALVWQGRTDEAEPFTRVAEQHTPADDVFTQMEWRSAHALVLRGRGDHTAAEKLARGAVAIAEATDYLESSARANCALAEVLAGSGQVREAAQWLEEARLLYERKESVFGVKRTRARLPELVGEALAERD